jgi:hypothetical protein
MKDLVEMVDYVNGKGEMKRVFFGLEKFESLVEKPTINHYTYDFDFIQKKDEEIKKKVIESAKNFYEDFDLIKENLANSIILIKPSNVAEKVVNEYRENLEKSGFTNSSYEINCLLDEIYGKMGFIGNNYKV